MINRKKLIINNPPTKSDINDCFNAFDLLYGKYEDMCFNYAKSKSIHELLIAINSFYSTRVSSKHLTLIENYIVKNIMQIYGSKKDPNIVNDIANVCVKAKNGKCYKAFASKLCILLIANIIQFMIVMQQKLYVI